MRGILRKGSKRVAESKKVTFTIDEKSEATPLQESKLSRICCLTKKEKRSKDDQSKFSVSSYTLRFSNKAMDMEYRNYRRKEVLKHSKNLLIALYIVTISLVCFDLNKKVKGQPWVYRFVVLIQGIITLFMTIGYLITRQKLYFADSLGPILMISLTLSIIIVNKSGIYEF